MPTKNLLQRKVCFAAFCRVCKMPGTVFGVVLLLLSLVPIAVAPFDGWGSAFQPESRDAMASWVIFLLLTAVLIMVLLVGEHRRAVALRKVLDHQRELEAKHQALALTQQSRERFISDLARELRTSMHVIMGFNDLLLTHVQGKPEALKVLHHTHQSAVHLMTVIDDLLDHTQWRTGELVVRPETFELRRVVEQAFELFKPRVQNMALDYHMTLDEQLPVWVQTDRHRLMQVLVNLLGNALKFTHQGSVVLRVQWQNPGVLFSVQDTGIGIPKARQPDIFKRFSQAEDDTQARYGGNGLGLAISQKLAHLLGGDMGFESEPGQGSRFWLQLPLTTVVAPAQKKSSHKIEVQTAQTPWRFLVVEDHPVNRLLVRQMLLSAWPECAVLEAVDGQQALMLLHAHTVDLVLMDMVMPVVDGIAATALIRADADHRLRALPVLGLTANVNPQDLQRFKAAGLTDVMFKPFEPMQLCLQIEALLAEQVPS